MGVPIGNSGIVAVLWCAGIGAVGYLWALKAFGRDRTR
jgi:ABC-2 type transport system permease protein